MGVRLQQTLAAALTERADDHLALLGAAWPVLTNPEADRVFALFFEAVGLAAIGREPYRTLVPQLVEAWIEWTSGFFEGSRSRRRAEAEATVAVIDGLLLLRQSAGPDVARRAARTIGIRVRR
jgi:hypothetical protein